MKTPIVTHFGGVQGPPPGSEKEVKIYIKIPPGRKTASQEMLKKTTPKKPPSGAARAPPEASKRAGAVLVPF